MYTNVAQTYAANQAQGMSKAKQVALVLDRAIASLRDAVDAIEANEIERRLNSVRLARNIVLTLKGGLDFNQDAELARNLNTVYMTCLDRMTSINTKNDPQYAHEVIDLLKPLRDAWHEAADQLQSEENGASQPAATSAPQGEQPPAGGLNLAT
ncbi:flagellar protein FliS [Limimonas halophila]|uniref:Flagellar secretion chaperone FliS n=1 Tax=Limimonas halophila TaxID=1082479 RepID=A0A1G7Q2V7_9PROT|nr:flagellar export chaperone FliS [Limimonas halophila]SDF92821.1 flagellar protein FliS [Limimonas halophila]